MDTTKTLAPREQNQKQPLRDEHARLMASFGRHIRAAGKSAQTLNHYVGASEQFLRFTEANNLPALADMRREHIEMWLERLFETYRPASVRNRFIGLRIFFRWLLEEGEITKDPTARIKPPTLPESPKDVVTPEDMGRVFRFLEDAVKSTKTPKSVRERRLRDLAMLAILYDCGMRASEVADLRTENLNIDTGVVFIPKTKNHRVRSVRLSPTGVRHVDRYWRRVARPEPDHALNGHRGRMTRSGVYNAVRGIFEECGIKGTIGAHDLRHTSASHVADSGLMSESDAMALYGWSDPEMWRHYTAQAREKAALAAHAKASPLERLPKKC